MLAGCGHSDAGSRFTSIRYGERLAEIGAVPSIGTVGQSFDNALAETVNGYCKSELIDGPAPRPARGKPSPTSSSIRNGPTNPRSKSNNPSLHQNQGGSRPRVDAYLCKHEYCSETRIVGNDRLPKDDTHMPVAGRSGCVRLVTEALSSFAANPTGMWC